MYSHAIFLHFIYICAGQMCCLCTSDSKTKKWVLNNYCEMYRSCGLLSLQDAPVDARACALSFHELAYISIATKTATGRGVSQDNGGQTMNERPDGRRDASKRVFLNRDVFQTCSVRLRHNCWISRGASCSGGRARRGTSRRPRELSLKASGIFTHL